LLCNSFTAAVASIALEFFFLGVRIRGKEALGCNMLFQQLY